MLKTTLLSAGLLTIAGTNALANPSTIPIDQAFKHLHKLDISRDADYYLDFADSGYQVTHAVPSNPQQVRAVRLSRTDENLLILRWTPNVTTERASMAVKVRGPSGEETITFMLNRTDKDLDNIRTSFIPSQAVTKVPAQPSTKPVASNLIRPDWTSQAPPTPKKTPPLTKTAKLSSRGRPLIDRATLDHNALANYLLQGLHRARGRREINRNHKNYWRAHSMARYLRREVPIDKALRWSHLPEKTYNDLLGHGGVSR